MRYQEEFVIKVPNCQPAKKDHSWIGSMGSVIDAVTSQIPFSKLVIIINVYLALIKGEFPSLSSNIDMISNGFDISLQGSYLHIGPLRQSLAFKNYIFLHTWSANDTRYVL